eukprot:TRINITY_DN1769_c0_g1_i1.p1 TRINITY_DN1769_c0_g1~~TRINITY_DN1769_c0_g1_i1.p1  ORF type:complete len:1884 (-),score=772.24 TRINITY_DN1769_c0_g1_i1:538-5838(-)
MDRFRKGDVLDKVKVLEEELIEREGQIEEMRQSLRDQELAIEERLKAVEADAEAKAKEKRRVSVGWVRSDEIRASEDAAVGAEQEAERALAEATEWHGQYHQEAKVARSLEEACLGAKAEEQRLSKQLAVTVQREADLEKQERLAQQAEACAEELRSQAGESAERAEDEAAQAAAAAAMSRRESLHSMERAEAELAQLSEQLENSQEELRAANAHAVERHQLLFLEAQEAETSQEAATLRSRLQKVEEAAERSLAEREAALQEQATRYHEVEETAKQGLANVKTELEEGTKRYEQEAHLEAAAESAVTELQELVKAAVDKAKDETSSYVAQIKAWRKMYADALASEESAAETALNDEARLEAEVDYFREAEELSELSKKRQLEALEQLHSEAQTQEKAALLQAQDRAKALVTELVAGREALEAAEVAEVEEADALESQVQLWESLFAEEVDAKDRAESFAAQAERTRAGADADSKSKAEEEVLSLKEQVRRALEEADQAKRQQGGDSGDDAEKAGLWETFFVEEVDAKDRAESEVAELQLQRQEAFEELQSLQQQQQLQRSKGEDDINGEPRAEGQSQQLKQLEALLELEALEKARAEEQRDALAKEFEGLQNVDQTSGRRPSAGQAAAAAAAADAATGAVRKEEAGEGRQQAAAAELQKLQEEHAADMNHWRKGTEALEQSLLRVESQLSETTSAMEKAGALAKEELEALEARTEEAAREKHDLQEAPRRLTSAERDVAQGELRARGAEELAMTERSLSEVMAKEAAIQIAIAAETEKSRKAEEALTAAAKEELAWKEAAAVQEFLQEEQDAEMAHERKGTEALEESLREMKKQLLEANAGMQESARRAKEDTEELQVHMMEQVAAAKQQQAQEETMAHGEEELGRVKEALGEVSFREVELEDALAVAAGKTARLEETLAAVVAEEATWKEAEAEALRRQTEEHAADVHCWQKSTDALEQSLCEVQSRLTEANTGVENTTAQAQEEVGALRRQLEEAVLEKEEAKHTGRTLVARLTAEQTAEMAEVTAQRMEELRRMRARMLQDVTASEAEMAEALASSAEQSAQLENALTGALREAASRKEAAEKAAASKSDEERALRAAAENAERLIGALMKEETAGRLLEGRLAVAAEAELGQEARIQEQRARCEELLSQLTAEEDATLVASERMADEQMVLRGAELVLKEERDRTQEVTAAAQEEIAELCNELRVATYEEAEVEELVADSSDVVEELQEALETASRRTVEMEGEAASAAEWSAHLEDAAAAATAETSAMQEAVMKARTEKAAVEEALRVAKETIHRLREELVHEEEESEEQPLEKQMVQGEEATDDPPLDKETETPAFAFEVHLQEITLTQFDEAQQREYCLHLARKLGCERVEVVGLREGSLVVETHAVGFIDKEHMDVVVSKLETGDVVEEGLWGKCFVPLPSVRRFVKLHKTSAGYARKRRVARRRKEEKAQLDEVQAQLASLPGLASAAKRHSEEAACLVEAMSGMQTAVSESEATNAIQQQLLQAEAEKSETEAALAAMRERQLEGLREELKAEAAENKRLRERQQEHQRSEAQAQDEVLQAQYNTAKAIQEMKALRQEMFVLKMFKAQPKDVDSEKAAAKVGGVWRKKAAATLAKEAAAGCAAEPETEKAAQAPSAAPPAGSQPTKHGVKKHSGGDGDDVDVADEALVQELEALRTAFSDGVQPRLLALLADCSKLAALAEEAATAAPGERPATPPIQRPATPPIQRLQTTILESESDSGSEEEYGERRTILEPD